MRLIEKRLPMHDCLRALPQTRRGIPQHTLIFRLTLLMLYGVKKVFA